MDTESVEGRPFVNKASAVSKCLHRPVNAYKKGPEVVFTYERGLTLDLRRHYHLYAVPKDATWRILDKK